MGSSAIASCSDSRACCPSSSKTLSRLHGLFDLLPLLFQMAGIGEQAVQVVQGGAQRILVGIVFPADKPQQGIGICPLERRQAKEWDDRPHLFHAQLLPHFGHRAAKRDLVRRGLQHEQPGKQCEQNPHHRRDRGYDCSCHGRKNKRDESGAGHAADYLIALQTIFERKSFFSVASRS